ncbi:hypothetical protein O3G_MSEX006021 [Manduca sexta]|uniref:Histone acetyltransferase n=1 Tax=Manduca sexta TaxID=7130 RepID=A0A921Z131_MANSE|nr:hypothetical protein O3G_MSEX006021 [Manduca sexta]
MTNLDVSNNSSTDSSSGSTSDTSSSESSSTSSGSGSSSSDSDSSTSDTPATAVQAPKSPAKPEEPKKKEEPKRRPSKVKVSSSSDDDTPKLVSPKPLPARRRCSAKPKSAATVLAKGRTTPRSSGAKTPKPTSKTLAKTKTDSSASNTSKKKSIFSPDNSSESDSESKSPKSPKGSPTSKSSVKSSEEKDSPQTPLDNDDSNSKESAKRKIAVKQNGPPPKKATEDKSASSCSSSQSSVETVSSDSDSEPTPKKDAIKTGKTKPPSSAFKQQDAAGKSGESSSSPAASMPRKLTRSLSARASRSAAARCVSAPRTLHTDTDSDDDRPNDKGKEVKKPTKTRTAPPAKSPVASAPLAESTERRCPVRGCDSTGHLGGKARTHFSRDACPAYHNVTDAWCAAASEERAAAAAARRRATSALACRVRHMPTLDQRAYQLKVKDMRSKWKGSQELREKLAASNNDELNEEREPILDGFAPDYDLKLFREAQALGAIKIEEELADLPADRGTRYVVMGKYMMEVWYQSPYPGEAARVPRLFVCEFCLAHHRCGAGADRHARKCVWKHPPGDEVYRKDNLSVWQVDGRKHKQYCQQLCLLAKFFLDHKTLYYDVEPFLFYVMTSADSEGCHIVGYFSKEKNSFLNYNVSCILTLPPYQRQGYGRLLIDFSYLLTKEEGKVGSPETPLSDLGLISYRSYWKEALLKRLCSASGSTLCIRDLSKDLAIASSDIVSTLQERGLMKYWKGKHIVLKKQEVLEEASRRAARARCVDPACLRCSAARSLL